MPVRVEGGAVQLDGDAVPRGELLNQQAQCGLSAVAGVVGHVDPQLGAVARPVQGDRQRPAGRLPLIDQVVLVAAGDERRVRDLPPRLPVVAGVAGDRR